MSGKFLSLKMTFVIGVMLFATGKPLSAQQERTIHSFGGSTDGMYPGGTVTLDSAGNFYGETRYGGRRAEGTVFELTRSGVTWTESVLHNFGNGTDGMFPQGNLIFDHAGNLFGTSILGGAYFGDRDNGGTVFQLRTK